MTYMPTSPVTNMSTIDVYRSSGTINRGDQQSSEQARVYLINPVPLNYKVRMVRTYVKISAGYQSASTKRGGCLVDWAGHFEANAWLGLPNPSYHYTTWGGAGLTKDKHTYCVSNGGYQGKDTPGSSSWRCDVSAGGQPGFKSLCWPPYPEFEVQWYTTSFPESSPYGYGRTYNGHISVRPSGSYHYSAHVAILVLVFKVP